MTPGARAHAAISVLDEILDSAAPGPLLRGPSAEAVLTRWARSARYAGSGDRAAVRDLVFSALRRLRSSAAFGGALTGRGVIAGLLCGRGEDPQAVFTGEGHAPLPPTSEEKESRRAPTAEESLDMPDWLLPELRRSLGGQVETVCAMLRDRAPVHLRVNTRKTDIQTLLQDLAAEGIDARRHPLSPTALEVVSGERRLRTSAAMRDGHAELQDAASQAVADFVPVEDGMRVLDICAGGGGKSLALAARGARVAAWDLAPGRMRDIPERADRAGVHVEILDEPGRGWDVILCDAPCSGSGAWRRSPDAKWRLEPERLQDLVAIQRAILEDAARRLVPGGRIVYATCSLFDAENRHVEQPERELRLSPADGADGFYAALFQP